MFTYNKRGHLSLKPTQEKKGAFIGNDPTDFYGTLMVPIYTTYMRRAMSMLHVKIRLVSITTSLL